MLTMYFLCNELCPHPSGRALHCSGGAVPCSTLLRPDAKFITGPICAPQAHSSSNPEKTELPVTVSRQEGGGGGEGGRA